jgi:TonB family protein
MLQQLHLRQRLRHYNPSMRIRGQFSLMVMLLLSLLTLQCRGQETSSATTVQVKRMQIPRYLPLAQQAGLSGEVTLHLTVDKAGKVVSVDVENSRPSNWGKGFASMAIEAAKQSEFLCASCLGDTFEHAVTYQFQFPAIPRDACTAQPKLPASKVDSASHVTVRPSAWPCVYP